MGAKSFAGLQAIDGRKHADPRRVELLVQLLEETSRDRVVESVVGEIKKGAGYLDVLAALLLAGVQEVQPRPSVGFKFHTVLAVNSYHLIGEGLSANDRWLPLLWGVDYFKVAQASDVREGNWRMEPVSQNGIPKTASASKEMLVDALQRWDEQAADVAAAAVARNAQPAEVFELFFRFGARDFRSIGHTRRFM